jgi:geranylgeranyl reductase family protein
MGKKRKIIIVGAGPTGCYTAQLLRKKGLEPLLIEEHKGLGRPVHCAGLVGRKVFDEVKINLSRDSIINTINQAAIHLNNDTIKIERKKVAYVIDREKFDKELGEGLDIRFETKFLGLEKENGQYIVETDRGDIKADIVIGADGARSLLREYIAPNRMTWLKGVQFRMKHKLKHKDRVEVYIEKPYFYWLIPESENIIRMGVLSRNPYQDLVAFIKRKKIKGEIIEKFAGIVPLNYPQSVNKESVFLVGDSGSQIKPLTYGGIYMGMRGAELLTECIIKEKFFKYNSLWKEIFDREISLPLRARNIFYRLSDRNIRKIFYFIKKNSSIIEKKGDFEKHSLLVWELLKQPKISKEVLAIFFNIVKENFTKEA